MLCRWLGLTVTPERPALSLPEGLPKATQAGPHHTRTTHDRVHDEVIYWSVFRGLQTVRGLSRDSCLRTL